MLDLFYKSARDVHEFADRFTAHLTSINVNSAIFKFYTCFLNVTEPQGSCGHRQFAQPCARLLCTVLL